MTKALHCYFGCQARQVAKMNNDIILMNQTPQMPEGPDKLSLMKGWRAEVLIDAALLDVWEQVTNFEIYSSWNPFVLAAHGEFEVGKTIRFLEDLKQFGQHWLEAQFLSIDLHSAFVWQGHFAAPFLFTVRHSFIFESLGNAQTRFTQVHEKLWAIDTLSSLEGCICCQLSGLSRL